jgi:hypothetical protein
VTLPPEWPAPTRPRVRQPLGMAVEGHEDRFTPFSLSGRCRLGKATFAGAHRGGSIAPLTDLAALLPIGWFDPNGTLGTTLKFCRGSLAGV